MERTISVEERIRRAEEIYERRKQGNNRPIATVNVNKEKKDLKLLRRMIIQILVCMLIYILIYIIHSNNYIFSQDFTNKMNEILSYDTNFIEIYENLKKQIQNWNTYEEPKENKQNQEDNQGQNQIQDNINQEAIGGAVENNVETAESKDELKLEETTSLSQEEQDIINIKNTATFIKPVEGIISSKYGQRDTATGSVPKNHTGTDIAANLGTKIKSATDGEVVLASEEGDYGKHLKIQIGEVSIIYAHCNNLYVKQGDKVTQGQEIAEVGSTGNSTGPHLHFEIRILERTVDPQSILEL